MLKNLSLYNESEAKQWDAFVESHSNGTPFHLSHWIRSLHKTYSYQPLLYILQDANNRISAVFPCFIVNSIFKGKWMISLPFSDYCGPLLNDPKDEKEIINEILHQDRQRIKCLEIRSRLTHSPDFICHNYYKQHTLPLLPEPDQVKKNIDRRTIQYCIRKAKKAGIAIVEENTHLGMEEFYRLNCLTRKKHGVPAQPKTLFENILNEMILNKLAFILLAVYEKKAIAAGLFLKYKNTIYYKYNASDPAYLTKLSPNHLLTWYAIEQACINGFENFDFGRTAPDNKGLMRYKEMWGAKPVDLVYYYYPHVKGATSTKESSLIYRMVTGIWRSLPNPVVDRIGPLIYKHMT